MPARRITSLAHGEMMVFPAAAPEEAYAPVGFPAEGRRLLITTRARFVGTVVCWEESASPPCELLKICWLAASACTCACRTETARRADGRGSGTRPRRYAAFCYEVCGVPLVATRCCYPAYRTPHALRCPALQTQQGTRVRIGKGAAF